MFTSDRLPKQVTPKSLACALCSCSTGTCDAVKGAHLRQTAMEANEAQCMTELPAGPFSMGSAFAEARQQRPGVGRRLLLSSLLLLLWISPDFTEGGLAEDAANSSRNMRASGFSSTSASTEGASCVALKAQARAAGFKREEPYIWRALLALLCFLLSSSASPASDPEASGSIST